MPLIQNKKNQKGSSLVEILVSLVILAIGILGIFALQTASLKSNQSAFFRTQATLLGFDMIERMKANIQAVRAENYDDPTPNLTAACLSVGGCTAIALAANDVAEWETAVAQILPSGVGIVCIDSIADDPADPADGTSLIPACSAGGDIHKIKIWWDDNRNGTADQEMEMTFQP